MEQVHFSKSSGSFMIVCSKLEIADHNATSLSPHPSSDPNLKLIRDNAIYNIFMTTKIINWLMAYAIACWLHP